MCVCVFVYVYYIYIYIYNIYRSAASASPSSLVPSIPPAASASPSPTRRSRLPRLSTCIHTYTHTYIHIFHKHNKVGGCVGLQKSTRFWVDMILARGGYKGWEGILKEIRINNTSFDIYKVNVCTSYGNTVREVRIVSPILRGPYPASRTTSWTQNRDRRVRAARCICLYLHIFTYM
jgi:hypothetical protein